MRIPPPERSGAAVRAVRRRWLRRVGRVAMWGGACVFGLIVALPALAFAWGAVVARLDVERGRGRLYGFGRMDPNGPALDARSGLRWRSLGCCVDPVSEAWTGGFNRVMRNAADRGEIITLKHLVRTREQIEAAFDGGSDVLTSAAPLRVSDELSLEAREYDCVLRIGERRERSIPRIHPRHGEIAVVLDAARDVLLVRVTSTSGGGCSNLGPATTSARYMTFEATRGECLQEFYP